MSLLFTLLHAHRRAPASLLPVLSLSPPRNISIIVHTHLLDEASFSRSDPLPPPCPLARPLSLAPVLSYRSESRSFYPRPYLFSSGFYFGSLALSLLSGLNTFVYDIPCSFFLLTLAPYPRVSQFLHFLTISLFLFHSLSFSLIPPTPSDSRYLRRKEDVSFPFFACHYYLRFTIYT